VFDDDFHYFPPFLCFARARNTRERDDADIVKATATATSACSKLIAVMVYRGFICPFFVMTTAAFSRSFVSINSAGAGLVLP
jgi:hypothetical protein